MRRLTEAERSAVLSAAAADESAWRNGNDGDCWWLGYRLACAFVGTTATVSDLIPIDLEVSGETYEDLARALDRVRVPFPEVIR